MNQNTNIWVAIKTLLWSSSNRNRFVNVSLYNSEVPVSWIGLSGIL